MTRARSLADELAELVNPAPQAELDPEAAAITEHDAPVRDDDELAGLVAGAAAGRRGIQADIAIEGGQYSGRRSSRAALFGDGGDGGDVSDAADTSDSEGALVPVQGSQRAPSIDYATIPTMFVNGHMNGPGPDDTTSSSSTLGDSQDQETSEDSQQLSLQQQQINTTVDNQQEDRHLHVAQSVAQQEQQQQQLLEADTPDHHTSSGDEQQPTEAEALGSSEQHDPQRHQHQQRDSGIEDDQEVYQSDSEDQGRLAAVDDVAAAAGAVAAMLGDDAEMQQLEREAAAAQAEASQQLVAAAAGSSRDAAKAAGVRAQQRLWGAALECRIRLQKAVAGANVMPRPAAAATFKAADKQIAKGYSLLLSACQSTLEEMLHLHNTLAQQHPAAAAAQAAAAEAAPPSIKKRSREAADLADHEQPPHKYVGVCSSAAAAWQAVDAAVNSLAGFCDASLDKWHRRTVLSSGTAALRGSSGLRALQQSVSSQVAALMSDQHKLINRSQLPRQLAPRPLGQTAAAAGGGGDSDDDDAEGAGGAGARDPETYDEGDFYQQLLKELIESAPGGSLGDQLAAARPAKRRKLVDRRASKGRKLRYHTLDKLVGFMAPTELSTPPFAQQLFANLFTHEG